MISGSVGQGSGRTVAACPAQGLAGCSQGVPRMHSLLRSHFSWDCQLITPSCFSRDIPPGPARGGLTPSFVPRNNIAALSSRMLCCVPVRGADKGFVRSRAHRPQGRFQQECGVQTSGAALLGLCGGTQVFSHVLCEDR